MKRRIAALALAASMGAGLVAAEQAPFDVSEPNLVSVDAESAHTTRKLCQLSGDFSGWWWDVVYVRNTWIGDRYIYVLHEHRPARGNFWGDTHTAWSICEWDDF